MSFDAEMGRGLKRKKKLIVHLIKRGSGRVYGPKNIDLNGPHYIKRKLSLSLIIQEKSFKPFGFNYQKIKIMKFWTSAALISVIATAAFAQGPFPIFGGAGGPVPVGLGGPVGGFGGGHPAFGGGPFGGGIPVFGGGAGGGFGGGQGGGFGGPSGGIPFSGPISSFGPPPQFGNGGGFGGPSGFSGGPSSYGGGGSGAYTLQGLGPSSEGGFGGFTIGGRSISSLLQGLGRRR
ncbi:hypothetical protein NPIL_190131 [Nephila pilipes]|uniref:Uncharacterized protein n=1 Tax=Nephila pilipes TaxID=299642 RepID=A0A8X6QVZ7_NEPPI|nr:hypothetical protein NPIL_190131 [Nephila pilipes]